MQLQAVTGQLYIVDGVRQEQGQTPGLLAQPAPSRAAHKRQREVLFAHLTLTGAVADNTHLLNGLLQGISEQYFKANGSVTASLRKVIQETNSRLLQMNLSGSNVPREGAITCAVLHDDELFIVQAGESLALLGHNFGVERIPARTPDHITPLGRSSGLDFRYYHQLLLPGDMLLLADPRIAHLPSHALSPALVDTELEIGLEELEAAVGSNSGRLMLVEFADAMAGRLPIVPKPVLKKGRITLPKGSAKQAAAAAAAVPAQPVREGQISVSFPDINTQELGDTAEYTARQAASHSALGLSYLSGWMADLMLRLRPPVEESDEGGHWLLPALIAIIIPLIVALVVGGVYLQRGRARQVAELRQEMSRDLVLAEEAGEDADMARQHYNRLIALAAEADEMRPGDPGVAEMRRQALISLDELDGVTRLTAGPFISFDRSVDLAAVTLAGESGSGIYALDGAGGSVYGYETDETLTNLISEDPLTLGFNGQAVGNFVVQGVVDIEWRPSGAAVTEDGLAMLDKGGALIVYYPESGETRAYDLGLSSEWQDPIDMAQYIERLYILDPPLATIWKYFPQEDGFNVDSEERTLVLNADLDLVHATDIDLYSEDGSLLVVYDDGRLRYYDTRSGRVQWDESDLLNNGLATPLQNPVAAELVGVGLNASIFILDAGNGRIIQLSRLGTVLAQYRATDERGQDLFIGSSDLAIAELPLRIFVAEGNNIYLAEQ